MPRKTSPDISQQVEAILREATAKIVALMEEQQEAALRPLQQALEALEGTLKGGQGVTEALRSARAARVSAARPARARKRPPRDQWVKTADVVVQVRGALVERADGARIAELRELTGFSDMQLHRALRQLRDDGEIVKEGELRKTVYRYVDKRKAAALRRRRSTSAGRGAAAKSPPKGARATPRSRQPTAGAPASGRGDATPKRSAREGRQARPPKTEWISTDEVKQAVRKALRRKAAGLKMTELCEATGYTDKQLHRAISALVDEGLVGRTGRQRSMRYVAKKGR